MKRIWSIVLLAALALTGCAGLSGDAHPDWDGSWTRIAEYVAVEPLEGFTLSENNDVLSMSGLYYAAWTSGDGRDFINDEGEDAVVYDAQIYVLLEKCRSAEAAEEEVGSWIAREQRSYETGESRSKSVGTQTFTVLPLISGSETNPYSRGAAAFAVREDWAVSVELVCADGFAGDPDTILEQFLAGFHYSGE